MRIATSIFAVSMALAVPATGQNLRDLKQQIQNWRMLPEDPAMREVCANDLRYSTEIMALESHEATTTSLLRWAEGEAERTASQVPDKQLAFATEMILMRLIERSYSDRPIYSKIQGGFPQWAYRSCLKNRPIDLN